MKLLFFVVIALMLFSYKAEAQSLKIISYNIHHGADRNEKNTLDSMAYFIKSQQPDLVGLQEVDSVCTRSGKIDQMKRLAEITGMYYAFIRHFPYQGGAYGVGILSRFPITSVENKRLQLLKAGPNGSEVGMLFARIRISKKKELLFVTSHFDAASKETRQAQVDRTISYLSDNRLPVIHTGDLNATPDTEEILLLQNHLTSVGNRVLTFPEDKPSKTIDYILVSPAHLKRTQKVWAPQILHSDHLPLVAEVVIK